MDDTQFILLTLSGILGILLSASSLISIILDLVFIFSTRKIRYLGGIFLHGFFGLFGFFVVYGTAFINIVSGGVF